MDAYYNYASQKGELLELSESEIIMLGGHVFSKDPDCGFQRFLEAFRSITWFSYRKDFPPISPSSYSSDSGWGCMLRSAQMMLYQAFVFHYLGRDNLAKNKGTSAGPLSLEILRWFADRADVPYSVHKFAQLGLNYGKAVGEWFGPSTVALAMSVLVSMHQPKELAVVTGSDGTIYGDIVTRASTTGTTKTCPWNPLLLLIPVRLGLDTLNPMYIPLIREVMSWPQSLGIIGGKPRSAMYFVGCQDDNVFFLDPHTVQPSIQMNDHFSTESFHCPAPRKMPLNSLDPSMCIGFYCKDHADFNDFWRRATEMSRREHSLFSVEEEAPEYATDEKSELTVEGFEDDIVVL
eukprot:TRINITY_DN4377_c0_g3_i1.p1 TRINITY_DN4377_c0_g3~~TRINITY_DN4377_c0_g3_i1.p1  ORF type:complete len:348 (-),score=88.79 TRINITY_DN4377_c0_g3_i1:71-1114(-)